MTDEQRAAAWRRDGYLVVRGALGREYLDPVRAFISERVDAFARERHADGELAALHQDEPFGRRYAAIQEELAARQQPSQGRKPLFAVSDLCSRALYDLYTHPAIKDVLRVIVGPEVTLHGISVIRVKLPEDSQTAFPWHQDSHYYNEHKTGRFEANTEHMRVITTWLPLVDVDTGNGCLWVIPGSHRWGFLSGARAASTGHVLIPEDVERRGTPTPAADAGGRRGVPDQPDAARQQGERQRPGALEPRLPLSPDRGIDARRQRGARGHRLPGHQVAQLRHRAAARAQRRPHAHLGTVGAGQPRTPRRNRTAGLRAA